MVSFWRDLYREKKENLKRSGDPYLSFGSFSYFIQDVKKQKNTPDLVKVCPDLVCTRSLYTELTLLASPGNGANGIKAT